MERHLPPPRCRPSPSQSLSNGYFPQNPLPLHFTADHDISWHGISFWSFWVSCSCCVPSQLLAHRHLLAGGAIGKNGADTVQALLKNSLNSGVLPTPFESQIQNIAGVMKKIKSIPAWPNTIRLWNNLNFFPTVVFPQVIVLFVLCNLFTVYSTNMQYCYEVFFCFIFLVPSVPEGKWVHHLYQWAQ